MTTETARTTKTRQKRPNKKLLLYISPGRPDEF